MNVDVNLYQSSVGLDPLNPRNRPIRGKMKGICVRHDGKIA